MNKLKTNTHIDLDIYIYTGTVYAVHVYKKANCTKISNAKLIK